LTTLEVDGTKPVTTLQIRLGDGTRQTARFNHTHTIADIRSWINAGNPGMASRNYVLMTTFPSKELSEEGMTIEEAKLMGSVVVQKWT
jgi:UBX domain-containing protein 1